MYPYTSAEKRVEDYNESSYQEDIRKGPKSDIVLMYQVSQWV